MANLDLQASKELVQKAEAEFLTPNSVQVLSELLELRARIDEAIVTARQSAEKILKTLNEQK